MQDWKKRRKKTGLENAGLEVSVKLVRVEIAELEISDYLFNVSFTKHKLT